MRTAHLRHACMQTPVPAVCSSASAVIPQSLVRSLQKPVADQHTLFAAMAPSNKIVKLDEFSVKDDLSHVQVVEAPVPEPKQGEVLVNAYLRPVNPTDVILIKTGWGGLVPLPSTPGSEGVGKVVKNGPGASKFKEGQRVAAAPWPGSGLLGSVCCHPREGFGEQQEHASTVSRTLVAPACWWSSHTTDHIVLLQILVPESLSDQTAAQIFVSLSSLLLTTACHVLQSETSLFNDRHAQCCRAISALHSNRCDMHDRFAMLLVLRLSRLYMLFHILPGHSSWVSGK